MIFYCIHINFYGLYRLLKDAGCNEMRLYTYPRLVKEGKELGVFLCVQINGVPMYGRIILRFSPCFPNLFSVLFFHNKSISNVKQNSDFGAVFSSLQGQVLLSAEIHFEYLKR